jgi:His/Glu/Gln/Arg/opine family amino acid ABC transporter permease subunit
LIAVLAVGWFLYNNMVTRLAAGNTAAGGALSWGFLGQTAGFGISEGPTFRPEESYGRAYIVGVINTLRVGVVGIILATVLGLFAGIARVSNNWLLNKLAMVYVEIFRSTPLLVQLLFWYVGVIAALPTIQEAAPLGDLGYLTNRGMYLTWIYPSETGQALTWWLLGGVIAGMVVAWVRRRQLERQGVPGSGFMAGALVFAIIFVAGFLLALFTAAMPATTTYELRRGDRGTLFADIDGNGAFDLGIDRPLAYVPITLYGGDNQVVATGLTDGDGAFRFTDLPAEATRSSGRRRRRSSSASQCDKASTSAVESV